MKKGSSRRALLVAATALSQAWATQAFATEVQPSAAAGDGGDIIVTARRRDEAIQDVPLTVNAVGSETLSKLNIRNFADVQTLVPGLAINPATNGTGNSASLRGVNFDANSSGNNATVQFYLNDAPIGSGFLFQSMFDVGQIEVLRGPQGTLRGVAAPSGSVTVTTHPPDLQEIGGYVTGTANSIGGINVNGAVGVPIVKDVLALRVAGLITDDDGNRVRSLTSGETSRNRSWAERVSLRFTPTEDIEVNFSYQHLLNKQLNYFQVESANLALGTPVVGTLVTPGDRAAVMDAPYNVHLEFNTFNVRAQWNLGPVKLNYTYANDKQIITTQYQDDLGNAFGSNFPGNAATDPLVAPNLQRYGQNSFSRAWHQVHEFRISSDERLFGFLDFTAGGLYNKLHSPTHLIFETPIFASAPATPANFGLINKSTLDIDNRIREWSLFGNVTAHLGENTEISGGVRHIDYKVRFTFANGDFSATIYSATIKHRFNDNIMAYASTGSSWRASVGTNGVILASAVSTIYTDPRLLANLGVIPETSKSYEAGVKTDWLDKRLRLNLTYYHQDYKNYIYTSAPIDFYGFNGTVYTPTQTRSGLGVGVPVKVNGVEAELAFAPSEAFNLQATVSYSLGKISNGLVPCPGATATPVAPPAQAKFCAANQRAGSSAPFIATVLSEYTHPVTDSFNGFVRGQFSYYGNSQNDPLNPIDDVKAYGLLNLYLGLRDHDGAWEVSAYAKNIFDTQRVLAREPIVRSATYATFAGGGGAVVSNYRGITMTAPREFGITAHYAFGSR